MVLLGVFPRKRTRAANAGVRRRSSAAPGRRRRARVRAALLERRARARRARRGRSSRRPRSRSRRAVARGVEGGELLARRPRAITSARADHRRARAGASPNTARPSTSNTLSWGSSSYIAISSSTTSRSASSSPKRGLPDHVAHHLEGALEVAVEHARVQRGRLLVGAGVDLGAHRVEDLVDLLRAEALGAAEQHVLEQVRDARLALVARRPSRSPIQKPSATERTLGTRSVTTRTPDSERRYAVLGVRRRAVPSVAVAAVARAAGAALAAGAAAARGRRSSAPSLRGRAVAPRRRRRRRRRCRRRRAPRPTCRRCPGPRRGAGRCGRARGRPRPRGR